MQALFYNKDDKYYKRQGPAVMASVLAKRRLGRPTAPLGEHNEGNFSCAEELLKQYQKRLASYAGADAGRRRLGA